MIERKKSIKRNGNNYSKHIMKTCLNDFIFLALSIFRTQQGNYKRVMKLDIWQMNGKKIICFYFHNHK